MLKKLKRRFILITMLLVGITILFVFSAVCVITYRTERQDFDRALEQMSQLKRIPIGPAGEPDDGNIGFFEIDKGDRLPSILSFSVLVDKNGEIKEQYEVGIRVDDDVLSTAISAAKAGGNTGTIKEQNLVYRKTMTPNGTLIVFASLNQLHQKMKNTVLISGAACMLSLILFFCISELLAGIAIRPIETAWNRQKQFVADASHDLKTPLTVILANTDILCAHKDETVDSQRQWVESTKEEAERMRGLADQMLALAQTETVKDRLVFEDVCISDLTERVLLQFEPVAFERQIQTESSIEPDIHIRSHGESYVRLVHILFDNAIKYSPAGGKVTVTLSATRQTVKCRISNTGSLIAPADLPHIFERFYRADESRTAGGYGLGLSIAKNLAEALDGAIEAESDAETGTAFTVILKNERNTGGHAAHEK